MSAQTAALLITVFQTPEPARYPGVVFLGLILVFTVALGVVLFLIAREARKESEEMRKLISHMRRLKERHESADGVPERGQRKVRRRKR